MDATYWHRRWAANDIAFHEPLPNARLVRYLGELELDEDSRIFVPLCGKTVDIPWLLANGYRVAGAELSEIAVSQLFSENGIDPEISRCGRRVHYRSEGIDIFVGNVFDLDGETLGAVDGIYDRGALVAMPPDVRARYARHLTEICAQAPQLVITCDYDHREISGSPFPVDRTEITRIYGDSYDVRLAERAEATGGLKGIVPAWTEAWILHAKRSPALALR